jgi:hypothetical protein
VLLAALSTRFVEQPFRGRQSRFSRGQVFALSAAGLLLFTAIGLAGVLSNGWASRYPPEVANILFAEEDHDPRRRDCLTTDADARGCLYGNADEQPRVALWGDSHAAVYSVMLGDLAASQDQALLVLTMPACAPIKGWADQAQQWRDACLAFQTLAYQRIMASATVRTVILAARWPGYPLTEQDSDFQSLLRDTINALQAAGKRVVLVYPVPELGEHVPRLLARTLESGERITSLSRPLAQFSDQFGPTLDALDRLISETGVTPLKPSQILCEDQQCFFYRNGIVYFYDDHHLSLMGAAQLAPLFAPLF